MKRLIVASMAIAAMILGSVFTVYIGIPLVSTHFHYERYLDPDDARVGYIKVRVRSTNVTVRFEDDPTRLYRVDVVQYQPGWRHRAYVEDDADSVGISIYGWPPWGEPDRAERVDIVLGTGTHYDIYILGDDLNVSVVYDNGAWLGSDELHIGGTGTAYLEYTEDISFNRSGMVASIDGNINATLVVDLPPGLNGRMHLSVGVVPQSQWTYGWSIVDLSTWGTPYQSQPLLQFLIGCDYVSFHLSI